MALESSGYLGVRGRWLGINSHFNVMSTSMGYFKLGVSGNKEFIFDIEIDFRKKINMKVRRNLPSGVSTQFVL